MVVSFTSFIRRFSLFKHLMIQLIYSPKWFYGKDIVIDVVSMLVLLLIAYFSIRYYEIDKRKNYLFLALSFVIMAVSFIFKIITNFTLYSSIIRTAQFGALTFIYPSLQSSDILFTVGFLIHRILMLLGLLLLYSIYTKTNRSSLFIITYLILISTYFSWPAYYLFHLTSLIFLYFITLHYWNSYKRIKHDTNRWLLYSFSLITLSEIVFIFIGIEEELYVAAEAIQLLGYIALLVTFVKVLKDGKKKRTK